MSPSPSERVSEATGDPVTSPVPTGEIDHFARLGLPRLHAIDRDALEDAYLRLAQQSHPDRFVGASPGEQRAAMERSAALNEGYRVLREPVRRAEYLCKLGGIDVDSSEPKVGAPAMSQAFLVEMIERREEVASAQAAGASALDDLRARVEDELEDVFDAAVQALGEDRIPEAARSLVERRYLQRLIDEIEQAAEG
ncbi:MAG: Fe-S protein assembly co-chaperone HscB [Myxococcota bacterium]